VVTKTTYDEVEVPTYEIVSNTSITTSSNA